MNDSHEKTDAVQVADQVENGTAISFADLGLDETVLEAVRVKGFTEPTPIQILAIPRLLDGDANVIAKARTGTGKTAAFGLPMIQELRSDKGCPRALVLVPTRELAIQVATEIESFRTEEFPRTGVVYGGASIVEQLRALRRGVEIVVGTPGRVIDHLKRGSLDLSNIEYFILDEADEMLNMGFIEDIEAIFGQANEDARVLMFSATMPKEILAIASNFMGEYEIVEEESKPEETILTDQFYWIVREDDKTEALVRLIDSAPEFYGLVFCQTKADADAVAKELDERHYQASALHGDIAQSQREKILSRFRTKKTRILVATDVAARGIDIEGLTHVVNYALPYDGPTYTHRIGRTGRAGSKGIAISFVRPDERRRLGYLRHHARGDLKEGKVPSVKDILKITSERLINTTVEKVQTCVVSGAQSENFLNFADTLLELGDPRAVLSSVLSIQYGEILSPERYSDIKNLQSNQGDKTHLRLYIQLGRRDGMTRRGIAQFFKTLVGVPERLVDRIEVLDSFSLATLPADAAQVALDLSKQKRNVPHMHIDVKDSGSDFHSGPRNRSRRPERRDGRDGRDMRDRRDNRDGRDQRDGRTSFDRQNGAEGYSDKRQKRNYSRGASPARKSPAGIPVSKTTGLASGSGAEMYRRKK